MRMRTCVALVGLLVTASGCTLTLPAGLPIGITGSPKPPSTPEPKDIGCEERFALLDKNGDKALTLDEFLARGVNAPGGKEGQARLFIEFDENGDRKLSAEEYAATCKGKPVDPKPTATPTAPSPRPGQNCTDAFGKYDRELDGGWDFDDFLGWDRSRPRAKAPCGGGIIANGGGNVVAAGGGNLIGVSNGPLQAGRGLAQANDGGGLIADNGGGLIANGPGPLIGDNGRGLISPTMPFPCPPDDPKFRFAQFDHDDNGIISEAEFCAGPLKRPDPIGVPSSGPEPYPYPMPVPTGEPGPFGCEDGFFRTDRDGDGLISPEEFKLGFAQPDVVYSNNDGRGEWISAPMADPYAIFKSQDRNGDGFLSLEESCGYSTPDPVETPPPSDWCGFYKLDGDNNGEATWEEFANWSLRNEFPAPSKDVIYTRFASFDFDQNWVVTQDEFCGFNQPQPYPYPQPSPVATAWPAPTPTPMPTSLPGSACLDTFLKAAGGMERPITFEMYAKSRIDQVRWIQAPSDEEIARMKENYMSEARAYDRDGDGMLSYAEAKTLCTIQGN